MSRRGDPQRRLARRRRGPRDVPPPEPFDQARAEARWRGIVATATCRGSKTPIFEQLGLGLDHHVKEQLGGMSDAEIIARTLVQTPS